MKANTVIFLFLLAISIAFGAVLSGTELAKPYTGPVMADQMRNEIHRSNVAHQQELEQKSALAGEDLRHAREMNHIEEARQREALRHAATMNRIREDAQRHLDTLVRSALATTIPVAGLIIAAAFVIVAGIVLQARAPMDGLPAVHDRTREAAFAGEVNKAIVASTRPKVRPRSRLIAPDRSS